MGVQTGSADFNPSTRDFTAYESLPQRFFGFLSQLITSQSYVLGVDISHWNTSVDFVKLKASGYQFVIIKATEGLTYIDPSFSDYWYRAVSAGMIVGTYHFFRSNYDGAAQANFHMKTIDPLRQQTKGRIIPPCNDVETDDGVDIGIRKSRIAAWNSTVRTAYGVRPLCYSSPYYWNLLTLDFPLDCTGFTAHWTSAAQPLWPVGWPVDGRKFWQYGVYPRYSWALPAPAGVVGECDLIRFYGTLDDLQDYVGLEAPTLEQKVNMLWDAHPELH